MCIDGVVTLTLMNKLLCDANRREGGKGDQERMQLVLLVVEMSVDV